MAMEKDNPRRVPAPLPGGWSGEIFVEVVSAIEREDWAEGGGRRRKAYPALRVTTYTDQALENSAGIKYRGKVYHADYVYMNGVEHGTKDGWLADHRDYMTRGLRTEAGNPLDFNSPVRPRLSDLLEFARNAFVRDNPGWARESLSMRLTRQIERARYQADSKRREAAEHDAEADRLTRELDEVGGGSDE